MEGGAASQTCLFIIVILAVILLIVVLCYNNTEAFNNFGDLFKKRFETFGNIVKNIGTGGVIHKVSQMDKVRDIIKANGKPGRGAIIAVLAPWCGWCNKLKTSGELDRVSTDELVVEVDDKHPETRELMQEVGVQGFPCLIIMGADGSMKAHEGPREASALKQALGKVQAPVQ